MITYRLLDIFHNENFAYVNGHIMILTNNSLTTVFVVDDIGTFPKIRAYILSYSWYQKRDQCQIHHKGEQKLILYEQFKIYLPYMK